VQDKDEHELQKSQYLTIIQTVMSSQGHISLTKI